MTYHTWLRHRNLDATGLVVYNPIPWVDDFKFNETVFRVPKEPKEVFNFDIPNPPVDKDPPVIP